MTKSKAHDYLMTLLIVVCIVVATVVCGLNITVPTAYADTAEDIQTRYEQTNVLNNLKGSTVGGKAFDVKDYPHNENGKPQIISFVEFCYSYYADKQSDYGLYIYVYNPQDKAIDTNTLRNKIQLTYGDKPSYDKYTLKFLNYSKDVGIEGRFYKFKIELTPAERNDMLKTLNPDERVYKVSGVELSVKNKVTEYTTAQVHTYKGFAIGYGSELAETDTLSCKVDGFDKYISLDVRSTYWRPDGTHEDLHSRDTLHSVYFAVPNSIVDEYGEMTGVHATWLNAQTAPIIVTGNKTIYNALEPYIAKHQDAGSSEEYPENKTLNYAIVTDSDMTHYGHGHYGTLAYNVWTSNDSGSTKNCYERIIFNLIYLFYADNGNADAYVLPAEKIVGDEKKSVKGWLETYTEKYGGTLVNNRYSKDLFDHVDDEFTEVNITANDEFKLTDVTTSKNYWGWLFGPGSDLTVTGSNTYNISAIQKITTKDFDEFGKDVFEDKFYVDASDYDELRQYVIESNAKNETVYLFRYYQSIYDSQEAREFRFVEDWAISRGKFGNYEEIDTNAYIAQMWIQLDFDIIDLTFTKDNVSTIIPVVMNPIDIAADADNPVYTTTDRKGLSWWQILLALLLGILVIILLIKFAPNVIVVIIKILLLLFKAMGAMFKGIGNATKPMRERSRQRRAERKEQKRIEKEQSKEQERQRKADEKQRKRKIKDHDRKNKRFWKWRAQESRRAKKQQKKADKFYRKDIRKTQRRRRKQLKNKDPKKLTLADLDGLSDDVLAELYFEEYGDEEFDEPYDFKDELPFK